jgi:hypothetical protein
MPAPPSGRRGFASVRTAKGENVRQALRWISFSLCSLVASTSVNAESLIFSKRFLVSSKVLSAYRVSDMQLGPGSYRIDIKFDAPRSLGIYVWRSQEVRWIEYCFIEHRNRKEHCGGNSQINEVGAHGLLPDGSVSLLYGVNAPVEIESEYRSYYETTTDLGLAIDYFPETVPGGISFTYKIFDLKSQAVPEPTSWAVFVAGFAAVGGALRRAQRSRRHKHALGSY